MFKKVFIEKDVRHLDYTKNIISKLPSTIEIIEIPAIENYWGKSKKPYLQKRENLHLYIGNKKGTLVKEAPDAYGQGPEKHFYFIHAYNCIYECDYCYLQGYFNTPDLVLFANHDEIIAEIEEKIQYFPDAWFHAGEFSDSLALSHLTNEWGLYFDLFKKYPKAKLEIRTKSVNIKAIEKLTPSENIYVTFSLGSEKQTKNHDLKTPPLKTRIKAMQKLQKNGFTLAIHFDPLIYTPRFQQDYREMIEYLAEHIDLSKVAYFSLGVVRFTKDVYQEVERNYPKSKIFASDMIKSFDNKRRYNRPMRNWMMNSVYELLLEKEVSSKRIYYCMEDDD
jgi:spore photoproduct lyase